MDYFNLAVFFIGFSLAFFLMILSCIIRGCVDVTKLENLPECKRNFRVYNEPIEVLNERGRRLYVLRRYLDYVLLAMVILVIIIRKTLSND